MDHNVECVSKTYGALLRTLKERIRTAQLRASVSVNRELVLLYWEIGRNILLRQASEHWGTKVIDRLSNDLSREFTDMKGFSTRNLKYMRAFADAYPDKGFVQEVLAQISWYHNITLLDKIRTFSEREWYIRQTIQNGWSRNVLVHQIESRIYQRQGKAIANFTRTLPSFQSDLALETLKDPYIFDFLSLGKASKERDLEQGLIEHIRRFLLELGVGFAFVGSQYQIKVDGEDFYIDLLFYHLRLRSYILIDLKMGEFRPEYTGKMSFYLSVVDDVLRHKDDQPSIGIILCKSKNKVIAEYALRDIGKPIGISGYKLLESLPRKLKGSLPTIQELETELAKKRTT